MTSSILRPGHRRSDITTTSLCEERYAEKLRTFTAGGVSAGHASERHLFWGGVRPKGSALVAPELEKWVASQLAEEAAILKERRKGREEREFVADPGGRK